MQRNGDPDKNSKERIVAGLSRGTVNKKWGAFTIAIWLALEAGGDDRKKFEAVFE